MAFEGELDETPDFISAYDDCVSDADEVSRAFLRSQIPEGAERLELAESFDGCIEAVGLQPLRYDPNNADEVAALAEVVTQLGYQLGDTGVADNERYNEALDCFLSHELLFPGRFESN
ncbi:MAG: hypothetical protein GY701_10520 [Sulfitobacter sp.]|nr:hypothetical protein [Sulfitobacter sp.]